MKHDKLIWRYEITPEGWAKTWEYLTQKLPDGIPVMNYTGYVTGDMHFPCSPCISIEDAEKLEMHKISVDPCCDREIDDTAYYTELNAAKNALNICKKEDRLFLKEYINFLRGCYNGRRSPWWRIGIDRENGDLAERNQHYYTERLNTYAVGKSSVKEFLSDD